MDIFSLDGKNAVAVGGTGGLGQAIAQGLIETGAQVVITSRREESPRCVAAEIKEACDKRMSWYTVDATDEESVKFLVDVVIRNMGQVDILVSTQGLNKKFPAQDFDVDISQQMLSVNVVSVMMYCKHFGR